MIKRFLKQYLHIPYLQTKQRILGNYYQRHPEQRANNLFRKMFGHDINWDNPTGFFEKMRVLQFRSDTSLWTTCTDKIAVRDYVAAKGWADTLIPLIGVWEHANDIDFNALPSRFAIKPNHGSGDAFIVNDKATCRWHTICRKLNRALGRTYGGYNAEAHYFGITPRIIAEQMLVNDSKFSVSMVDYKFYCVNGEPTLCIVMFNRTDMITHTYQEAVYDTQWNARPEWADPKRMATQPVPKPAQLEKMLSICRSLSADFAFVRVDLYISEGKIYFGELTFTPEALKPVAISTEAFAMIDKKLNIEPFINR